jgi:hypothetical protein
MSPPDAPIVASDMPVATVRTSQGGISGFVVKSGTDLVLVEQISREINAHLIIVGTGRRRAVGDGGGLSTGNEYFQIVKAKASSYSSKGRTPLSASIMSGIEISI